MKFAFHPLRPCVINAGPEIQNRSVSLADDRKRLKHIVEDHACRLRNKQLATNRVEAAIDPHWSAASGFTFPDPLFESPIETANRPSGSVMTLLAQNQLTSHAADLRVGKIADQLRNRARSNFRSDV